MGLSRATQINKSVCLADAEPSQSNGNATRIHAPSTAPIRPSSFRRPSCLAIQIATPPATPEWSVFWAKRLSYSDVMRRTIFGASLLLAVTCIACAGPEAVRWTLEEDPPNLEVPELRLLGFETNCASGRSAEGRISYDLTETVEELRVMIKIKPPSGDQTCPGNPPTPIVVPLQEPLGERSLIDDATGDVVRFQDQ